MLSTLLLVFGIFKHEETKKSFLKMNYEDRAAGAGTSGLDYLYPIS